MRESKVCLAEELGLPTGDNPLCKVLEDVPANVNWAQIRERLLVAFQGDEVKVTSAIPLVKRLAELKGVTIQSFAGTVTDCSCGRPHESHMNPETGATSVDTGWY